MNESESIEFKKSLAELGEGLNSMAAILNKHAAGELWFGIKNDGTPVGMEVTETTLRKVSQSLARGCKNRPAGYRDTGKMEHLS
jgi:ATP-dependent DNA helicase RecG